MQYGYSIFFVLVIAAGCYAFSNLFGYQVAALILLVSVSLIAMFFDILPVLLAALVSALVWNFFFIPPKFTFHIDNAEDVLLFFMYFIIALLNAALTFKIRAIEKVANKKEEKEVTIKLYNTLLNSLSHELRTPISTIIAATDNLQADSGRLSAPEKADLLAEISKASLRLNTQVANLLNMSRLEAGNVQPKLNWCDVNELIYAVLNRLKENLGDRQVNIIVEEPMPLCKLDEGLMEQVLYNLIINAHLYTPVESSIQIHSKFSSEGLVLVVQDNGNGLDPSEINLVFDKFYRSKNTLVNGTGLGLSIVKGFTEVHKGKIVLDNIPGGGARFTITIPAETNYINKLKNE